MRARRQFVALLSVCLVCLPVIGLAAQLDGERIGQIVGVKAMTATDGVVRVSWPRNDVPVNVDAFAMHPFMALGSWAAFQPVGELAILMGDTVLFEDEVNPALDAVIAADMEITALHNHMMDEEPAIYFAHFWGKGKATDLARGLRSALDAQKAANS